MHLKKCWFTIKLEFCWPFLPYQKEAEVGSDKMVKSNFCLTFDWKGATTHLEQPKSAWIGDGTVSSLTATTRAIESR
jgi:hypothetical protein